MILSICPSLVTLPAMLSRPSGKLIAGVPAQDYVYSYVLA